MRTAALTQPQFEEAPKLRLRPHSWTLPEAPISLQTHFKKQRGKKVHSLTLVAKVSFWGHSVYLYLGFMEALIIFYKILIP